MDNVISSNTYVSPYELLCQSLSLIPISHYFLLALLILLTFVYNFLEIHFFHDLLSGFRGDPVSLTYKSSSQLYQSVAAKCQVLHERYRPTAWLSSSHLQTAFLSLFGNPPDIAFKRISGALQAELQGPHFTDNSFTSVLFSKLGRHLFHTPDGGTIALDWLMPSDVMNSSIRMNEIGQKWDITPIVVVVPGLTSDSTAPYIKHLAFKMARKGWSVVVSNHRGLGGVSITSDCFYNAGWTEDLRKVVEHIQSQFPEAPLFAVGTSIGANVLVKYLGEEGAGTPVVGAAAVCCPWDLLICDRFINRRLVQKLYDRVLTIGLQGYAQLHQSVMSRLANWEGIQKSRSVRDFDNHATRILGKFETVDAYYRHSSSVNYLGNILVPLLCISALDDPVCSREAIPWDECRANENIVLATTQHGGHLAFYEGMDATSMWWVRAVDGFFEALNSCPFVNREKKQQEPTMPRPSESSIDEGPYVNITEDGLVSAISTVPTNNVRENIPNEPTIESKKDRETKFKTEKNDTLTEKPVMRNDINQPSEQNINDLIVPLRRRIDQLSRRSRISIWLLAWIAVSTTWPFVGSALILFLKRRFNGFSPIELLRKKKSTL